MSVYNFFVDFYVSFEEMGVLLNFCFGESLIFINNFIIVMNVVLDNSV